MWKVVYYIGKEKKTQHGFLYKVGAEFFLMSIVFTGVVERDEE